MKYLSFEPKPINLLVVLKTVPSSYNCVQLEHHQKVTAKRLSSSNSELKKLTFQNLTPQEHGASHHISIDHKTVLCSVSCYF